MASIVVYIDVREGAITGQSRFALFQARRIADSAGASVYGLLAMGHAPEPDVGALAASIRAAGADRVLCCCDELLAGPALDATHGALALQIAEHLRPLLFLFPAGGGGAQLGPSLAIRTAAAYVPCAGIDVATKQEHDGTSSQRVLVRRWRASRDGMRKLDVGDLERPVVAVLAAGDDPGPVCESDTEIESLPCPDLRQSSPAHLAACEADRTAAAEMCSTVIWSGLAISAANRAELERELPSSAALVCPGESPEGAQPVATPSRLLVIAEPEASNLPLLAPAQKGVRLRASTRKAESRTVAAANQAVLDLSAAIRNARARRNGEVKR